MLKTNNKKITFKDIIKYCLIYLLGYILFCIFDSLRTGRLLLVNLIITAGAMIISVLLLHVWELLLWISSTIIFGLIYNLVNKNITHENYINKTSIIIANSIFGLILFFVIYSLFVTLSAIVLYVINPST